MRSPVSLSELHRVSSTDIECNLSRRWFSFGRLSRSQTEAQWKWAAAKRERHSASRTSGVQNCCAGVSLSLCVPLFEPFKDPKRGGHERMFGCLWKVMRAGRGNCVLDEAECALRTFLSFWPALALLFGCAADRQNHVCVSVCLCQACALVADHKTNQEQRKQSLIINVIYTLFATPSHMSIFVWHWTKLWHLVHFKYPI